MIGEIKIDSQPIGVYNFKSHDKSFEQDDYGQPTITDKPLEEGGVCYPTQYQVENG